MNADSARDIFLKVMNFEPCDRTLKWEFGYWIGAVERWYREGLPKVKGYKGELKFGDALVGPGIPSGSPSWSGTMPELWTDIGDYFDFGAKWEVAPYNYWIYPRMEKRTIFEDEEYIEYYDSDGVRKRELKDKTSMPMFLEFPVKNRNDWEQMKEERFNFNSIDKRFAEDSGDFLNKEKNKTGPLGILDGPVGFFGAIRWLIGEENLFLLYYDDPGLIKDMLGHLCKLWIQISERLTSKIDFDIAIFWEDMSGKQGSMISPATFKEFMTPHYKELTGFLKARGVELFSVDSDGYVGELIPLFMDAGLNLLYPFEQQAGNDLIEYRKRFPELRMTGGVDKNILFKGRQAIDKELEKIPFLINQGGYIPYMDHLIPPNGSWKNFKYYREKLNKIIDSTKVLS